MKKEEKLNKKENNKKDYDLELDWYEIVYYTIMAAGFAVVVGGVIWIIGSALTMHDSEDIRNAIVEHINEEDNYNSINNEDIIILDRNGSAVTFVKDELLFVSKVNIDINGFSSNDIEIESTQQIKQEFHED